MRPWLMLRSAPTVFWATAQFSLRVLGSQPSLPITRSPPERCGWTRLKVNRCLVEGRSRLGRLVAEGREGDRDPRSFRAWKQYARSPSPKRSAGCRSCSITR
jgi:hypothetical protein